MCWTKLSCLLLLVRASRRALRLSELGTQVGNFIVERIDLIGNVLKEDIYFIDIVSTTLNLETLLLNILGCNRHNNLSCLVNMRALEQ